jgi:hypothetical protein
LDMKLITQLCINVFNLYFYTPTSNYVIIN